MTSSVRRDTGQPQVNGFMWECWMSEEQEQEEEEDRPVCEVIKMMSSPKHAAFDWTAPCKSLQTLLMPSVSSVIGA